MTPNKLRATPVRTVNKAAFLAVLLMALTTGCVSSPSTSEGASPGRIGSSTPESVSGAPGERSAAKAPASPETFEPGPFYKANIGDFETRTLSNGIKLYVKRNRANRVLNLKLVILGGASRVPRDKAGLDGTTLSLLSRGSAAYSYESILDAEYRTSSSISYSSGYDYSSYDLNCIDTYFPELLEIYLDGFLRPAFRPERFQDVRNEAAQAQEARMGDPDQRARYLGTQAIFAGHPYASDPSGTPESLDSITIEDVRAHHGSLLNADRIFLAAVGNFDVDALAARLETALGTLPRKGSAAPVSEPPKTSGPPILEAHPASEGVAYIQGYFRIPGRQDKDYIPFAIAADMLDDLMFNVVREKYGACYSVGAIFRPAAASYGILWIYQASDIEGIRKYVKEAADYLAQGKLIRSKDASGQYVLASIEDRLPAYRSKYVNAVFANQRTNSDIAAQVVRSVVYAGDPADYLRTPDRIHAVTPADIRRVYKTWFLDQSFRWVIVSDEAGLKRVPAEEYR